MQPMRAAVVGGGWAGCAAAIALARRGARVTLFEAAPVLGGRARTVLRDGLSLDNGQHVLLGAYTATRALAALLHAGQSPFVQIPLALRALVPRGLQLRARALPGSLGLAAGLMCARGLSWRERIANARWFSHWQRRAFACDPDATVTDLMSTLPTRAAAQVWAPLCVAALNTPPARASGQVFLNVLAAAFGARRDASDLLMPAGSLGAVVPDAAVNWLLSSGHSVRLGVTASIESALEEGVHIAAAGTVDPFDAAVIAVGPHQLARAFASSVAEEPKLAAALQATSGYDYESITTIYLGYRGARVAVPSGLVRLDDDPGQWLFERADVLRSAGDDAPRLDQLFAMVISTSGPHDGAPQSDLVRACDAQLRRARPALPALAWSQVIAERRATYACVPRLAHPDPRVLPRVCLAGDYVYPRFPATLEAAVRSGEAAAQALS